jgi:hypothetical protein
MFRDSRRCNLTHVPPFRPSTHIHACMRALPFNRARLVPLFILRLTYAPSMTMDFVPLLLLLCVCVCVCFPLACSEGCELYGRLTFSRPLCEALLFRALLRVAITACCGEVHFGKRLGVGGEMRSKVPGKRKWIRRLQLLNCFKVVLPYIRHLID